MGDTNYNTPNYGRYNARQRGGSEFGGTVSRNTVQPKGADALTAGEQLRLGYLVGDLSDTRQETPLSLGDRRQMLGLKPSTNERPRWLAGTGKVSEALIRGLEYPDELADDMLDPPRGY